MPFLARILVERTQTRKDIMTCHFKIRALLRASLMACLSLTLVTAAVQAAPFKKGQKFPAFTLKTTDGKVISPSTLKNKAYWLTFFASG